jgi:hypothetical protein
LARPSLERRDGAGREVRPAITVDERTIQKIEDIRKGVELIAEGVNSYSNITSQELKAAFGTVHSTLLNRIAFAALEAAADRCDYDDRFYPVIKEAARLVRRVTE